MTGTQQIETPVQSEAERWRIGIRYKPVVRADGTKDFEMVPLTEDDLLHPIEGDQVSNNDYHNLDVAYLHYLLLDRARANPRLRVFRDHLIDFQQAEVQALSPDIALVEGEPFEWDGSIATFRVADMRTRVLFIIEVTSPSTRRRDLSEKMTLYYDAGVPLYIIADLPYGGSRRPKGLLPFHAGPQVYELAKTTKDGTYWIEAAGFAIGIENGRIACYDASGSKLDDPVQAKADRDFQKSRAEAEKARAEAAEARVDEEKQLREAAEARIRELEAKLNKPQ